VTNDEYLQSQIGPMLQPGEQVMQSAYMRRQPGLVMQMLLVGGLLLFLITKAYFVVLTNRRLILIRTKMKFLSGGPQQLNLELEQHDVRNLKGCTTSGIANNRSMTFSSTRAGSTRCGSRHGKADLGTAQFLEQVPQMITSGQLAQLAAGAPRCSNSYRRGSNRRVSRRCSNRSRSSPQVAAADAAAADAAAADAAGFSPGQPVVVTYPDGNRYSATVAQFANGQYLCTMPDGQSYWFPVQAVGAA
jgi:hypothetical protein